MKRLFRSAAFAAIATILSTVVGAIPARASSPAITSPAGGPPTTRITVTGSGFGAYEAADVYFDATDMILASTDASGAFAVAFRIPSSAQPGTHYITAVGRSSGLSAQKPYTVITNWSQFHFNAAHTGSNPYENTLNASNVANLDEAWQASVGSAIESSPAVVNGVVFVGADNGGVYALNAATGTVRWSFSTGGAVKGSPAVAGGIVYVGSEDGKVYALNASNGTTAWVDDLSVLEPSGFDAAPVAVGGIVYVAGTSGNVYALDAASGFSHWANPTEIASPSIAVASGLVFAENDGAVAIDASTGQQRWTTFWGGVAAPAVAYGTVYNGAFGQYLPLSAANGNLRWSASYFGDEEDFGCAAIASGVLYLSSTDSKLWALDASTGTPKWTFQASSQMTGSAIVVDGVVYTGSNAGTVYGLDRSSGAQLWSAVVGGSVVSSPAVANGTLFVTSSDGSVHAYALPVPPAAPTRPNPSSLRPDLSLQPRPVER